MKWHISALLVMLQVSFVNSQGIKEDEFRAKVTRGVLAKEPANAKPVRVLLFAGNPTREYQFVRAILQREVTEKRMELSVLQQTRDNDAADPDTRFLSEFPDRIKDDDPKKRASSLSNY